jgi:CheY-like chemotaxis protein
MRRILVVDDDPHIGLAIRAWLKRYGFRVSIADGGTKGLAALDKATFNLMIVDIFMPNMRGFESIRMFHEHAPGLPLIAISGSAFSVPDASGPDFLRRAKKRDALPAQAVSANDIARRDRRMPVGGRASSRASGDARLRHQRTVRTASHRQILKRVGGGGSHGLTRQAAIEGKPCRA